MIRFYLYRTCTRQLTTDGELVNELGTHICDTAEHTLHRLPEGTYRIVLKKHTKLRHRAPCILPQDGDAGGAQGWLIHGNGVHGRDFGAGILMGEHLVPGVVIRSHPYFGRFVKRMEKALKREDRVELVILSRWSR